MITIRLRTGKTVEVPANEMIEAFMDTLRDQANTKNPVALLVAQSVKQAGEGQIITCLRESLRKLGGAERGQAHASHTTMESR